MTDSKREARVITHVFNVGGFFGEPVPMIEKEFYDSLLKENQELRGQMMEAQGYIEGQDKEINALKEYKAMYEGLCK